MAVFARIAHVLLLTPRRSWRYATVAAVAFVLGSATLVAAAAPAGISIGSLFFVSMLSGVPTTPCSTLTGPDGNKTTTCIAVINSNGELSTSDAAARAALAQFQFGPDGALKVASQGTSTIAGNVSVNNLPATQQVGGTVNVGNLPATQQVAGSVSVSNLPTTQQVAGSVIVSNLPATQQIAGSVDVSNFPADQQIHGTVTVTNMSASGAGGVTTIALASQHLGVGTNDRMGFWTVDVSACRSFSVFVWTDGTNPPEIFAIEIIVQGPGVPVFEPDLKTKNGVRSEWAFPVMPFSNEPFYAAGPVDISVLNRDSNPQNITGTVYCQH